MAMNEQTPFGAAIEFAENPENRCPCVLVLDVSSSMGGAPIRELQQGLKQYTDELLSDSIARKRVEVAIITFGDSVRTEVPFSTADSLLLPQLNANGVTPMAGALLESVRLVEERKAEYRSHGVQFYRPWIILITDGAPTDGDSLWATAVAELKRVTDQKGCTLFVVGVTGADFNKLSELPAMNGPQKLDGTRFKDMFLWLSQSQKAVSRSSPGDQIALPAPQWTITS